mmetsp:Transcript_16328/g.32675  ORF Transcript_16328/g.32675 Transcript_16328/m.32675 type:complete len:329 (-) Transcript_16328:453-1439(-)
MDAWLIFSHWRFLKPSRAFASPPIDEIRHWIFATSPAFETHRLAADHTRGLQASCCTTSLLFLYSGSPPSTRSSPVHLRIPSVHIRIPSGCSRSILLSLYCFLDLSSGFVPRLSKPPRPSAAEHTHARPAGALLFLYSGSAPTTSFLHALSIPGCLCSGRSSVSLLLLHSSEVLLLYILPTLGRALFNVKVRRYRGDGSARLVNSSASTSRQGCSAQPCSDALHRSHSASVSVCPFDPKRRGSVLSSVHPVHTSPRPRTFPRAAAARLMDASPAAALLSSAIGNPRWQASCTYSAMLSLPPIAADEAAQLPWLFPASCPYSVNTVHTL